jgi:tetratricopeptide (TPR) repeat protein
MGKSVFISYSTKDKLIGGALIADEIRKWLEARDVSCWIAPRDIIPGEKYGHAIVRGIEECEVFLLIFSSNSRDSQYTLAEVEEAFAKKKKIITYVIDNTEANEDWRLFLNLSQKLPSKPYNKNLLSLLTAITNYIGHTTIYDKPDEHASEVKTSKENYTNQAKDGLHIVVKTIVAVALLVGILTILPQKAEKQPYAVSAIAPVVSVESPPNISSSSHMTPEQCYEEGKRYYRGSEGRVRDYEAAVRWFRAAADKGMAEAQNALGVCYFEGQGVEIDYDEAVRLFKAAAEKGNHHAQNNLASRYYKGEGVLLDYEKAVYWYEKAAMNGNIYAQYNLGICYYEGNGVSKNTQEAIKWIEKSARMGNQDAMSWLESKKGSLKSGDVVFPVF